MSQLKNCVEYYNREKYGYDALLRQRKSLETSFHINQKGIHSDNFVLNSAQIYELTLLTRIFHFHTDHGQFETISEKLHNKHDELKYCIFLTENCLYLLWAHLDFFMYRAISRNPSQFNMSVGFDCKFTNFSECCLRVFIAKKIALLHTTLTNLHHLFTQNSSNSNIGGCWLESNS